MSAKIHELLKAYKEGLVSEEKVLEEVANQPFEEHLLGRFDHLREARTGVPEAIFAEGKEPGQVAAIFDDYMARGEQLMATRVTGAVVEALGERLESLYYNKVARIVATRAPEVDRERASVLVISAGASDRAVAEEVAVSSELLGNPTDRLYDCGVAGLSRLIVELERMKEAGIIVVVAGMDGALPSVVGGLVKQPLIAVPTSVGYGTAFGGVAPLLTMLNACSPGTAVMNIDNGYGAAVLATKINQFGQRMAAKDIATK